MAWDFATEPEFEEQLEWMRGFVRDEIYPLEPLKLDEDAFRKATDPLKQEVKARGLWAAHLPPELGGGGFGQVKLGLMHEILGATPYGPVVFGNNAPDSGNAELLAIGGSEDQRARWMQPLLDGKLRSAFSMTEPGAGADPTPSSRSGAGSPNSLKNTAESSVRCANTAARRSATTRSPMMVTR